MSQPDKLSASEQEVQFKRILKKPANSICADCSDVAPSWTSLGFGVIICMNCSGAHRAMGPKYTPVRSTRLDTWVQQDIDMLDNIGNNIANEYYEHHLPKAKKPNPEWTLDQLIRFANDKYLKRLWAQEGLADPKTRFVQCQMSGVPFRTEPVEQVPVRPKASQASNDQISITKFYSDNGSGNIWNVPTPNKFNSISGPTPTQVQVDVDLLSSGRNKPSNNFNFTEADDFRQFNSTPGGFTNWQKPPIPQPRSQANVTSHPQSQAKQPQSAWDQPLPQQWQSQSPGWPQTIAQTNTQQPQNQIQHQTYNQQNYIQSSPHLGQQQQTNQPAQVKYQQSQPTLNPNLQPTQPSYTQASYASSQQQQAPQTQPLYQPPQPLPQQPSYQSPPAVNQASQSTQPWQQWNNTNTANRPAPSPQQFNSWSGGATAWQQQMQGSLETQTNQYAQQQRNQAAEPGQQFKNNPFASEAIMDLYTQQSSQQVNPAQRNYDYLRNNPFI